MKKSKMTFQTYNTEGLVSHTMTSSAPAHSVVKIMDLDNILAALPDYDSDEDDLVINRVWIDCSLESLEDAAAKNTIAALLALVLSDADVSSVAGSGEYDLETVINAATTGEFAYEIIHPYQLLERGKALGSTSYGVWNGSITVHYHTRGLASKLDITKFVKAFCAKLLASPEEDFVPHLDLVWVARCNSANGPILTCQSLTIEYQTTKKQTLRRLIS